LPPCIEQSRCTRLRLSFDVKGIRPLSGLSSTGERRVLLVGIDGLRPDMFRPDVMPNLARLVESGIRATEYHSVYPSHTRTINTTHATGCAPGKHGWTANVFRFEGATEDGIINTASESHVKALDNATAFKAIQVPTLGDILARHGKRVGLATSQSSGASLIWSRNQSYPVATVSSTYGRSDMQEIWDKIGPPPKPDPEKPSRNPQSHWAKRAVIDVFLDDPTAAVIMFYMIEPDFSLHLYGLGTPEVDDALRECDTALGDVIDAMEQKGIRDQFDVIVLSDHGHSSIAASGTLTEHLDRARESFGPGAPQLAVASDYIYADPGFPAPTAREIEPVVRWLQEQTWTGAVFGSGELCDLPGVIPLSALWNGVEGDRAPLLGVNPAWSHHANENGVPGTLAALTEHASKQSTHGSCSPYEMHPFWAGCGPSFREGATSELPAGATDLTPTVLGLLGIEKPAWVDGRVMWEMFQNPGGEVPQAEIERVAPTNAHPDGFNPVVELHRVGTTTYIHQAINGNPESFHSEP
jgi:hypothetical protein